MLYLRAAAALVAAITFPLTALGQTSTAIAVFTAPGGLSAQALATGATSARFDTTTARYITPPNFIFGIVEVDPRDCTELDSGKWITDPNPTLKPVFKDVFKETPAGTVGFTRIQPGIASGGPCDRHKYNFAAIDFSWMAHYNRTALKIPGDTPPPCAKTDPVCPTAVFMSEWTTMDGAFDIKYTFRVSVDVVRPAGETNMFINFYYVGGADGRWAAQLTPPTTDPTFDFKDEVVQEIFQSSNETCAARAPGALGPESVTPKGVPGHWTVGQFFGPEGIASAPKNVYGYDFVGWKKCTIEAYRCAGVTVPSCGNTVRQLLQISSPADPPGTFADYIPLKINKLVENITGYILKGSPDANGIGIVQSQRGTDGGLHDSGLVPSKLSDCSNAVITASHFFDACLLVKPP